MALPTPRQQVNRERIEGLIALAAPLLDLVLAVGDRVSRAAAPESEHYPIRPPGETFELTGSASPGPRAKRRAEDD
jgi:hypothetical protein